MLFLLSALPFLSAVLSLAFRSPLFSRHETVYKQKRLRADMFDRCALILFRPTSLAIISSNCFSIDSLILDIYFWRIKNTDQWAKCICIIIKYTFKLYVKWRRCILTRWLFAQSSQCRVRQIPFQGQKCGRINFLYSWRVNRSLQVSITTLYEEKRNEDTHKKPVLFYLRLVKNHVGTWWRTAFRVTPGNFNAYKRPNGEGGGESSPLKRSKASH